MRHWYCLICLPPLLFVAVADRNVWTRRPGQVFELSSCLFSNESDYQLHYSCYDPEGVIETSRKPNTFSVTERLCDESDERRDCKNLSLYFFQSQKVGLCISSNTTTLAQESVRLYYTVYSQYLPICVESRLHRRYVSKFSCTDLDYLAQRRELAVTITGYDVLTSRSWMTTFNLKLVHNCSTSQSTLHEELAPLTNAMVHVGISLLGLCISIANVTVIILLYCHKARMKKYKLLTQNTRSSSIHHQLHLITNFQEANMTSSISSSHGSTYTNSEFHCEDTTIITNNNNSTVDTISTESGPQETNTNSSISLPNSISTGDDPQQATSITFPLDTTSTSSYPQQVNSSSSVSLPGTISTGPDPHQATNITIPLDTASTIYPQQVSSNSSVSLPDTISTDSQPQQVDTTSNIFPSDSSSSNQREFNALYSGATNLIPSMHRHDNSS